MTIIEFFLKSLSIPQNYRMKIEVLLAPEFYHSTAIVQEAKKGNRRAYWLITYTDKNWDENTNYDDEVNGIADFFTSSNNKHKNTFKQTVIGMRYREDINEYYSNIYVHADGQTTRTYGMLSERFEGADVRVGNEPSILIRYCSREEDRIAELLFWGFGSREDNNRIKREYMDTWVSLLPKISSKNIKEYESKENSCCEDYDSEDEGDDSENSITTDGEYPEEDGLFHVDKNLRKAKRRDDRRAARKKAKKSNKKLNEEQNVVQEALSTEEIAKRVKVTNQINKEEVKVAVRRSREIQVKREKEFDMKKKILIKKITEEEDRFSELERKRRINDEEEKEMQFLSNRLEVHTKELRDMGEKPDKGYRTAEETTVEKAMNRFGFIITDNGEYVEEFDENNGKDYIEEKINLKSCSCDCDAQIKTLQNRIKFLEKRADQKEDAPLLRMESIESLISSLKDKIEDQAVEISLLRKSSIDMKKQLARLEKHIFEDSEK